FHIVKIGLFGSFARDEQTEFSDIDLIIEIDSSNNIDLYYVKNSLREFFTSHFKRKVDLVREKYLPSYARDAILRETIFV
ncbi:MAG: nucleotidyltransferase domain-containing protein, partial [Chitinispirillaceae bacterium]|nr:nucleotidyltransferase domain-containing protein [Chitinispirillaceae bacterium]